MPGSFDHYPNFISQYVQPRQVDVCLPGNYAQMTTQRYPVIYMHDGQNLFDPKKAHIGVDWGVHEALTRLVDEGIVSPAIIVGIWNTDLRWPEYLPERPFTRPAGREALARLSPKLNVQPQSDAYLRFLVTELKPFIDEHYRTLPGPVHTFVIGSSMGGLVSLYALCEYPHIFSAAGCLSTHWPALESVLEEYLPGALPSPGRHRIYFDYGTETLDAEYEPFQKRVDEMMIGAGFVAGKDWLTRCFPGADHSERSWRQRVHIPLKFLLE